MPLNPKGTMFPFNGDIQAWWQLREDAGVGACLVPVSSHAARSPALLCPHPLP